MTHEGNPRFEPIDRRQVALEPLDVEQLIADNHPARSIWSILGRLNLGRFCGAVKAVEGHAGRNLWEPRLLIAMWIYAYSRGISSAREMERLCGHEPGFRWLTGLKVVNHHSLSDFRVAHGEALQKEEAEQERRTRSATARRRAGRERVERLETALAEVERLQSEKKNEREKPCQPSVSDADAQFMWTSDHGLAPAYNVQLVTDSAHKLVVDVAVSKQPSDAYHLLPALDRVREQFGSYPAQAVADGDYTKREAIMGAAERGVDYYGSWAAAPEERLPYGIDPAYHPAAFRYDPRSNEVICPEGKRLAYKTSKEQTGLQVHLFVAPRAICQPCPERSRCTPQNRMAKHGRGVTIRVEHEAVERYHAKMQSAEAKRIYQQRAPVAEFPHAWLKDKLKWVRVRCHGLAKVSAEALWAGLTYNLQRYFKLRVPQTA